MPEPDHEPLCPRCRGTGYCAVDFWRGPETMPCPEPACVDRATIELALSKLGVDSAGAGGDRPVFKGGAMKISASVRGFEMTPAFEKTFTAMIQNDPDFAKSVGIEIQQTEVPSATFAVEELD